MTMSDLLWTPSPERVAKTNMAAFQVWLATNQGVRTANYSELHAWSVQQPDRFWSAIWDFCEVIGDQGNVAWKQAPTFSASRFFPTGRLNFAENLLRPADGDLEERIAILARNEQGETTVYSRQRLLQEVTNLACYFQSVGVKSGDRIAAILPNVPEAIVAMLAAAAIGAIWSCCSPDFGQDAICDRFSQIAPKILVTKTQVQYNGKQLDLGEKSQGVLDRLPGVQQVLYVGTMPSNHLASNAIPWIEFSNAIAEGQRVSQGRVFQFEPFPFDHPLYILYSSGTTGAPKCIVHGAGGSLLQHAKELRLHSDVQPDDRLFYYTTTGWMMWNWLVSGLQTRATIVLYDGGPLAPKTDSLFALADELGISHFGASAKYFAALDKEGCKPASDYALKPLRVLLSTGSPLLPETYDYLYRDIKSDVNVASISGGTDIVSCFVLGNPLAPVYRGQIQCAGLGMNVQIFNENGQPTRTEAGELVCTIPFPSMPVSFWNDPQGAAYQRSYFEQFQGVWCHGDWAQQTPEEGFIIFGRSDATLNPGGIRIGTAEIYRQVEAFEEIVESLATAYRRDGDEQIVLFLRMQPGKNLDANLVDRLKKRLRERCSPRHVPSYLFQVADIPRTISGKISELAVRNAIHRLPIKNEHALANPECLDFYRELQFEPA